MGMEGNFFDRGDHIVAFVAFPQGTSVFLDSVCFLYALLHRIYQIGSPVLEHGL